MTSAQIAAIRHKKQRRAAEADAERIAAAAERGAGIAGICTACDFDGQIVDGACDVCGAPASEPS